MEIFIRFLKTVFFFFLYFSLKNSIKKFLGLLNFSNIKLYLNPLILGLKIFLIIDLPSNRYSINQFQLNLKIIQCEIGEIYISFINSCSKCPHGSFSFNFSAKKCESCPEEASFCYGNLVELKPGFWRSKQSLNIFKCKPYSMSCL